jgi:hypothetical protein
MTLHDCLSQFVVVASLCAEASVWAAGPGAESSSSAVAASAPASQPVASVELSELRAIAADCLTLVRVGKISPARRHVKYLEAEWDELEPHLRSSDRERSRTLDHAVERVVSELRAVRPNAMASEAALRGLLEAIDRNR